MTMYSYKWLWLTVVELSIMPCLFLGAKWVYEETTVPGNKTHKLTSAAGILDEMKMMRGFCGRSVDARDGRLATVAVPPYGVLPPAKFGLQEVFLKVVLQKYLLR